MKKRKTKEIPFVLAPVRETLENRIDRVERKVDSIIEFFGIHQMSEYIEPGRIRIVSNTGEVKEEKKGEEISSDFTGFPSGSFRREIVDGEINYVCSFDPPLTEAEAEEFTREWEERHTLGIRKNRRKFKDKKKDSVERVKRNYIVDTVQKAINENRITGIDGKRPQKT